MFQTRRSLNEFFSSLSITGVSPLLWALAIVSLLYILQLWTPLRLTTDSVTLLSIASSAADGRGFLDHGQLTHFPPGYPAIVVCMERFGAARSWGFVGLNALLLFAALACASYVARNHFHLPRAWSLAALLFAASSFVLVKHFTLPLTDIPYMGLSMIALALLVRAEKETGRVHYVFWISALFVSIATLFLRPIGIALLPALFFSSYRHMASGDHFPTNRRVRLAWYAFSAILVSAGSVILLKTQYVQEALSVFEQGGAIHAVRDILLFRVHEIGELFLNAPANKLGPASFLVWIYGAAGCAALIAIIRRSKLRPIEMYLAAYCAVIFVWPYPDTRFWIPLLPLLFAEIFSSLRCWAKEAAWKRNTLRLCAAIYLAMGIAAMTYSTWITFSGREFPNRYGSPNPEQGDHIRATYQAFYLGDNSNNPAINQAALEVLRRYSATPTQSTAPNH